MNTESISISFGGLALKFSTEDRHSSYFFNQRWYVNGEYIHELCVGLEFVKRVRSANLVLDIGANIGWYTMLASKANPEAPVFSYEMDETNFNVLRKNVTLNGAQKVSIYQLAVSDSDGTCKYSDAEGDSRSGLHLVSNQETFHCTANSVKTVTLDGQFSSIEGAVIKIDVEGAEQKVLLGARRLLEEAQRLVLFIEVHPEIENFGHTSNELIGLLVECGYAVGQIVNMRSADREAIIAPVSPGKTLQLPQALVYAVKGDWSEC